MLIFILKIGLPFLAFGFISGVFIGRKSMRNEMVRDTEQLLAFLTMMSFLKEENDGRKDEKTIQDDGGVEHRNL